MRSAMVDTEIWSIAKKEPRRENFVSREEYARFLEMHKKAQGFFVNVFPELKLYMSIHQLAEIFHVLAFRGARIPRSQAEDIVKAIIEDSDIVKVPVTLDHVEEAVKGSAESNIHIWDYLCFIPVKDYVDAVFTCDSHFIKMGEKYNVRILNPLGTWITL